MCGQADVACVSGLGLAQARDHAADKCGDAAAVEIKDDLMMLHALAAFDRTQISHKAIMAVTHAGQSAVPEHLLSMHLIAIPSNLDGAPLHVAGEIRPQLSGGGSVRLRW